MYATLMRKHIGVFNIYLFQTLMLKYVNYQYYLFRDLLILNVSCVTISCFKLMKNHVLKVNNTLIFIVDYPKCIFYFHSIEIE
jgi:hypothetical protein